MAEEEEQYSNGDPNPKSHDETEKIRKKNKRKKHLADKNAVLESEEEDQPQNKSSEVELDGKSNKGKGERMKSKKGQHLLEENVEEVVFSTDDGLAEGKKDKKKKKKFLDEADKGEEGQEVNRRSPTEEENLRSNDEKAYIRKIKMKRRLLKEAAEADKRGICYLSRIPPHMDPFKLRQILSQYGDTQRIYLTPENPVAQARRKRGGQFQEQRYSEGWVEFSDKRVAKRVANMLNGEQIGGRKRSSFYFDLWNIKYLSKFKWDDLTEEIANKNAIREQKMALEISAAKRERDFYLSKVDQARALSSIEERLKKKQKLQQESGTNADAHVSQHAPKVVRKFPQKQPVADKAAGSKARLSKDILAGVFGGS